MPMIELLIEQLATLPQPIPGWQRLGIAAGNPFTTWEWASTWWRRFGEDRPQRILGLRDPEGAMVGILPLYLSSGRPLRTLRFVGNGPADQLGPVCRPEHREAVAAAFRRALAENRDWDVCVAERLPVDDNWAEQLGGVVTRTELTPTISLETTDWDEYLATRSSHFRQQVRRLERRLGRDYELTEDPQQLRQDMDTFFDLHEARWAATGSSSTVFSGEMREFHQELRPSPWRAAGCGSASPSSTGCRGRRPTASGSAAPTGSTKPAATRSSTRAGSVRCCSTTRFARR